MPLGLTSMQLKECFFSIVFMPHDSKVVVEHFVKQAASFAFAIVIGNFVGSIYDS